MLLKLPGQALEDVGPASKVFAEKFSFDERLRQFGVERFRQLEGHQSTDDGEDAHDDDWQDQPMSAERIDKRNND